MLDVLESKQDWRFSAFGKHPAAKDFFRLGDSSPFVDALSSWVEKGYSVLTAQVTSLPPFCSWRFWGRGYGKQSLVCGVVRLSSDSLGRLYPLIVIGTGPLPDWEQQWELIPFACEKTWCQIEYVASTTADFCNLKQHVDKFPAPVADWKEMERRRRAVGAISSPTAPYASFLDVGRLKDLTVATAALPEQVICLDRGPCNDKILQMSLWNYLFRTAGQGLPNFTFLGGDLEKAYMVVFRRPLAPGDFVALLTGSSAAIFRDKIAPEFAMDLSALGKEPISPDLPVGIDVRSDPLFDELQAEVDRTTHPVAGGEVDWSNIVRIGAEILCHKSKDLLIAGYLVAGLIHTRGADGLALGLKIYRDLLENYGVTLFPERERARVRSVEWWTEKCEQAVKRLQEPTFDTAQVALMEEHLAMISQLLSELLPEAPSPRALRKFINGMISSTPSDTAPIGPEPLPGDDTNAGEATLIAEPVPAPAVDSMTAVENAVHQLQEAAKLLRDQDITNQLSYRLSRQALWISVVALPSSDAALTKIPAPPVSLRSRLAVLQKGDPGVLVREVESELGQFIFWLDLNRVSSEALASLANGEAASSTIREETALLLRRLPGLEELAFSDGTPFADKETKQWIRSHLTTVKTTEVASTPVPSHHCPLIEEIRMNMEAAGAHIAQGRLLQATEIIRDHLVNGSGRERLQWRLAFSRLLLEGGNGSLALPYLEQMMLDIDHFDLAQYDPASALECLIVVWQGFQSQKDQYSKAKASEALQRIGRIDLLEMAHLVTPA